MVKDESKQSPHSKTTLLYNFQGGFIKTQKIGVYSEYIEHIENKRCPAKVCRDLIYYDIIEDKCTGCHACYSVCPVNAISGNPKDIHNIDQDTCVKCGLCFEKCPDKFSAIEVHPGAKVMEV